LLNRRDFYKNGPCTVEYNNRNNKFYIVANPIISTGLVVDTDIEQSSPAASNRIRSLYECTLSSQAFTIVNGITTYASTDPKTFAFPATTGDESAEDVFFAIIGNNLTRTTLLGTSTIINNNSLYSAINGLAFVKNPDELIRENVFLATNSVGQILRIGLNDASLTVLPDSVPFEIVGITSTIDSQNLPRIRHNPLPFTVESSRKHWMFVFDLHNAADLEIATKIRPAFNAFLTTFLRQNDVITLIFFTTTVTARQTFTIRTLGDISEIGTFFGENYVTVTTESYITNATALISAEYRDVEAIYFIGKANYADIEFYPRDRERFLNVTDDLRNIVANNSAAKIYFIQINTAGDYSVAAVYRETLTTITSERANLYNWTI
jgi:hypothetical protein